MKLTDISQRTNSLGFGPLLPWPEKLPVIVWDQWLITGFNRSSGPAVDLADESDFMSIWTSCYSKLSLPELSRIYFSWNKQEDFLKLSQLNWDDFFKFYGFRNSEIFRNTLLSVSGTPESFQEWVTSKSVSIRDLSILHSFKDLSEVKEIFEMIAHLNISKSQGVMALEWGLELFAMGNSINEILENSESSDKWLKELRKKRLPMSIEKDIEKSQQIKTLPWPQATQAKWNRVGDESGIEVKFQIKSREDFNKKIKGLSHVSHALEKDEDSLWGTSLIQEIDQIFIHRDSLGSDVAERVFGLFPSEKIKVVHNRPHPERDGELSAREFSESKRTLYLEEFKGSFFKRCPGARPGLTCCNYFVLNLGLQCNMNCSYCYLQSFINTPVMTIYTNIDKALEELKIIAEKSPDLSFRVGTGETIDSLSLDEITGYSRKLIRFFRDYPNWKLEFKTKSAQVEQFLDEPHSRNVLTSWSVNPQYIIEREEHGTASLDKRLKAAEKCRDKGFLISFHLDPVIWHPEWKETYSTLVDEITSRFEPGDVPIMSVGALRFQPEQRHMMRERFGMKSLVVQGEMFQSSDGKLRYDQSLRKEMFHFIVQRFKENNPKWNIFLCMETPETWLKAMDSMPKSIDGLGEYFDHQVIRKYKQASLGGDIDKKSHL